MDSMPSSSEEESSESDLKEDNDVEVVLQRVHVGFGALGLCLMENCISLVIYVRKSGSLRIWRPPKRLEQSQPPNRLVRFAQPGAKLVAKPAPCSIASSSSARAAHHVPVMQTEHVQQFQMCYSRTQKFFTVPLDPQQHSCYMNHIGRASIQKSLQFACISGGYQS